MSFFKLNKRRERNYISPEEHREIARALEKHHAIFERVWAMSRIRYTKKVPTAAVFFNKRGELVDFAVNKEFWEGLSFDEKCFVLAHECLHIALNHGRRSSALYTDPVKMMISNISQDLVINHALVNRYGFNRDKIDTIEPRFNQEGEPIINPKTGQQVMARKYCWVDSIFAPEQKIREDENFEYYYNLLYREYEKQRDEMMEKMKNVQTVDDHDVGNQTQNGEGQPGGGMPQPGGGMPQPGEGQSKGGQPGDEEDNGEGNEESKGKGENEGSSEDAENLDETDFDYFDPANDPNLTDDFEPVIEKLNEELNNEEKENLKKFVEDNKDSNQSMENPDYGPTGVSSGVPNGQPSTQAGTTAGTAWTFAKETNPKKQRKWESIITDWTKKRLKETYRDVDQFVFPNRRFSTVIGESDLMLPSEYEIMDRFKEEDMIDVWFFQDTSGSCSGYTDRFFSIAEAMPQDRFRMRLFCFDTKVYETNLESRQLYGFGGTYFHILENRIQEELRNDPKFKYPDAVFVVTDGYGSDIVPEKPEKWHWILTPNGSKRNIPETCKFYDLAKYE